MSTVVDIADRPTLPINMIVVHREKRQRKVIDTAGLEDSIKRLGVLQPIIVRYDIRSDAFELVAGERRLTACRNLGLERIPVRYTTDLSPIELRIVELEENVKRKQLTWQEEAAATAEIHRLRSESDPKWTQMSTAASLSVANSTVTSHIRVAEQLADARVAGSKSMTEALAVIERVESRKRSNELTALMRTRKGKTNELTSNESVLNMSFLDWAPSYEGPRFNFIHCDFPYGIGVADGPVGRGLEHTFYDDTLGAAAELLECFITNINRFFDMSGHIMFWYSDKQRDVVMSYLNRIPGMVWLPHPLIWHHAESGISPDYRRRPKHVYDTCMLGMRDRMIIKVQSDVFQCPTDTSLHPSTKPEAMLTYFMSMLVDSSTYMLDPTCGAGSSLRIAEALGASRVLGLEIDPNYYDIASRKLGEARLLRAHRSV